MRSNPRLGLANFALVAAYFVPTWGHQALHVLTSPFGGFDDRAHAVAAIYIRNFFDFGLAGLIRTSQMLAVLKMVMAAAFVAYLIEFARALATRQDTNRETVDIVLTFALATVFIWIPPILASGDAALIRLEATQFLLLVGSAILIMIDRQIEPKQAAQARQSQPARAKPEEGAEPAYS